MKPSGTNKNKKVLHIILKFTQLSCIMLFYAFCACLSHPSMMRTGINCHYRMLILEGKHLCKITLKSNSFRNVEFWKIIIWQSWLLQKFTEWNEVIEIQQKKWSYNLLAWHECTSTKNVLCVCSRLKSLTVDNICSLQLGVKGNPCIGSIRGVIYYAQHHGKLKKWTIDRTREHFLQKHGNIYKLWCHI